MLTTELIPIDRIRIPNPRSRNQHIFHEVVDSIGAVGLKRPVTVARRKTGKYFDLVCGQGRIEALQALGQTVISAIVLEASEAECMVMSLVENVARRRHSRVELLGDIARLKAAGYEAQQIAAKTGLSTSYVAAIAGLLEKGEQRLINGVEQGTIPLSVAVEIASMERPDIQDLLQRAYESGALQGRKFIAAKRLLESRFRKGKSGYLGTQGGRKMNVSDLVRTYERDAERKRHLIREAQASDEQMAMLAHLVRTLLKDPAFRSLLEARGFLTMPASLARRIDEGVENVQSAGT
jgi:ParB family chromosome partitioning protein